MNENIIQRIVRLTKEQGRQDKELCEYIGVAQSTFVNWKNRNTDPKSKYLPKIAEFFNVDLDYLTTGMSTSHTNAETIESLGIYASFAKEAKDEGIDPEDIKNAIELIKSLRSK